MIGVLMPWTRDQNDVAPIRLLRSQDDCRRLRAGGRTYRPELGEGLYRRDGAGSSGMGVHLSQACQRTAYAQNSLASAVTGGNSGV